MATVYEVLRLLSACGWRQAGRSREVRILNNPRKPGVRIILTGEPAAELRDEELRHILSWAGLDEEPK